MNMSKLITIIIAFSAITFVFTSSLVISSEHNAQASSLKKELDKILKKAKKQAKDNNDKKDDEKKDDEKKDDEKDDEKKEANTNYDYSFSDEGDTKREDFNFVAAGDYGCSKNAKNTISSMKEKKPELVLPLGDLSVDGTANCWLDMASPFDDRLEITFGYSEVKDGDSKLNQYKKAFGLNDLYYSFDYRHVHFVTMSTLSEFNQTSDQYKFVENDLKKASENQNIDWIVVTAYGPFYTSPSAHPAKNDIRNVYHPLFDKYGVDLVLHGHNHNYQRTYPITFNPSKTSNPTVTNTFATGYQGNKDGVVYAIVGTAGEGFHPLEGQQPYVAKQLEGKFGFIDIQISNGNPHTRLTGTFYDTRQDIVQDTFSIEKEIKDKNSNVLVQYQEPN